MCRDVIMAKRFRQNFTAASLSLTKRWRRKAKLRSRKLLGPDQFLLAFEPLLKKNFDFACSIPPEAHGTHHSSHVRRGDGVTDLVAIQRTSARDRIGHNLNARIGGTYNRIGGAIG